MTQSPKILTSREQRRQARWTRDRQWQFMERVAEHNRLWFCVWNKDHLPEQPDEWRDGLITGMEIQEWMARHRDWFVIGRWNEKRYARPIRLTDGGRAVLGNRDAHDMGPVFGGLVEPGWQCVPAPPSKRKVAA